MTIPADRLVAEALAKSGLLWLTSDAGSGPVWYAHHEGVAYVLYGPGEQRCPAHHGRVEVVARSKDTRARLATFDADATVMSPQDDDWDLAMSSLKAGRLNASGEDQLQRWANACTIVRLTPDLGSVIVRGQHLESPQTATAQSEAGESETAQATAPHQAPQEATQ